MTHTFEMKIIKDGVTETIQAEMTFSNGHEQQFQYMEIPPIENIREGDHFRHFLTKLDEFLKSNGGVLKKLEIKLKD